MCLQWVDCLVTIILRGRALESEPKHHTCLVENLNHVLDINVAPLAVKKLKMPSICRNADSDSSAAPVPNEQGRIYCGGMCHSNFAYDNIDIKKWFSPQMASILVASGNRRLWLCESTFWINTMNISDFITGGWLLHSGNGLKVSVINHLESTDESAPPKSHDWFKMT